MNRMPSVISLPPRCTDLHMGLRVNTQSHNHHDQGQLTSPYHSSGSSPPSSVDDMPMDDMPIDMDRKHLQFVCPRPERFLQRCAKRAYKATPPLNSSVLASLSEDVNDSDEDSNDDEFDDGSDEEDEDYFASVNRGSVSERRLRQCGFEEDDDNDSDHKDDDVFELEA